MGGILIVPVGTFVARVIVFSLPPVLAQQTVYATTMIALHVVQTAIASISVTCPTVSPTAIITVGRVLFSWFGSDGEE